MKLRTVLCLTMLALGSLACSGVMDLPTGVPSAALSEPWSAMDLPIGDGNVLFSDGSALTITYEGNQVKTLGPKYRDALEKGGWEKVVDAETGEAHALTFKKNGKTCSAAISFGAGQTVAGLTMQ